MRIIHKYKIYTKAKEISRYPTRVIKFKRTKWLAIKKLLLKKENNSLSYSNNELIKIDFNRWYNMHNSYRNKVLNKRSLLILFNNNKRALRKILSCSDKETLLILRNFFKQHYILDYSLFLNGFFPSVYAAKEAIKSKSVFVNKCLNIKNSVLKKGDFVFIKDEAFDFNNINKKFTKSELYSTYNEVDFYSQSFVILKDLQEISNEDFAMSIGKHLNINK